MQPDDPADRRSQSARENDAAWSGHRPASVRPEPANTVMARFLLNGRCDLTATLHHGPIAAGQPGQTSSHGSLK
jgi:hypothetical protein